MRRLALILLTSLGVACSVAPVDGFGSLGPLGLSPSPDLPNLESGTGGSGVPSDGAAGAGAMGGSGNLGGQSNFGGQDNFGGQSNFGGQDNFAGANSGDLP